MISAWVVRFCIVLVTNAMHALKSGWSKYLDTNHTTKPLWQLTQSADNDLVKNLCRIKKKVNEQRLATKWKNA